MPLWCRRGREDEKYSGIVWQVKSFEIVTLFHEKKWQISRVRLKLSLFWYSRRQVKKAQSTTGNCNFLKFFIMGSAILVSFLTVSMYIVKKVKKKSHRRRSYDILFLYGFIILLGQSIGDKPMECEQFAHNMAWRRCNG